MDKMIKVYGRYDLIEWDGVIPCANGVRLHVHFEGGSASTNGVVPATYRTSNGVIQALIEGSDLFHRGAIKLVRVHKSAIPSSTAVKGGKAAPTIATGKATPAPAPAPATEKEEAKDTKTAKAAKAAPDSMSRDIVKEVKVANLAMSGKHYLVKHFGLSDEELSSDEAITAAAAARGIVFLVS